MASKGTIIATGASRGIGAGAVHAFLQRGYNVVANSRDIISSGPFRESDQLALVAGNIGESEVAAKIVDRHRPVASRGWLIVPRAVFLRT